MITFDDFSKVEIRAGKIISAEKIPDTDKLLKLMVDFAEQVEIVAEDGARTFQPKLRQIVSGISLYFPDPQVLVGKTCMFVTNLEPRMIKGHESNGMLFAVIVSIEAYERAAAQKALAVERVGHLQPPFGRPALDEHIDEIVAMAPDEPRGGRHADPPQQPTRWSGDDFGHRSTYGASLRRAGAIIAASALAFSGATANHCSKARSVHMRPAKKKNPKGETGRRLGWAAS